MALAWPPWAFCEIVDEDVLGKEAPHPDELACLPRTAVAKRRRDFSLGRIAARRALTGLGCIPGPVLPDANRAPQWPDGVVGSITHSAGRAAALVAREHDSAGVGIDLEVIRPLQEDVARLVADAEERAWIGGDISRLIRLFSAKESLFKALYRFEGAYFGFDAVHLVWAEGGFEARLNRTIGNTWQTGTQLFVHCRQVDDEVWTALWLPCR